MAVACPARELCTEGERRQLTLPPRGLAEAQGAARAAEKTTSFQADYARRAGVEGTMHQATAHGARAARYRGLAKTRLDHMYMACALSLLRLEAYWNGTLSTGGDRSWTSICSGTSTRAGSRNPAPRS